MDARPLYVLIAVVVILAIVDAWWIGHFRHGYPLDIDESGYMQIAFHYTSALRSNGLSGLWHAFTQQTLQAPLVPLVAVPLALVHESIQGMLYLELVFFAILAFSTYGVARQFTTGWWAALAAGVVAALPGVTFFSRLFVFAVPAAAVYAAALYALLRTRSFALRAWSICFGILLGLCPLTRTMMVGIVPGLLLAAAVQVLGRPQGRIRAAVNLGLALVAAAIVASVWFAHSWSTVGHYLTNLGYGSRSVQGAQGSELTVIVRESLNAPLLILLAIVLVAGATEGTIRLSRNGSGAIRGLRKAAASEACVLAIVVVEGYAALASTSNKGSGFEVPLLAPIVLLAVWTLTRLSKPGLRTVGAIGLGTASLLTAVATSNIVGLVPDSSSVDLPMVGRTSLANSVNPLVSYYFRLSGYRVDSATAPWPAGLRLWNSLNIETASALVTIAKAHRRAPFVLFGMNDPLFNINATELAAQLKLGTQLDGGLLDPTENGGTVMAYREQLLNTHNPVNLLVVAQDVPGEFPPQIDQSRLRQAARGLGFRVMRELRLPDGRPGQILWRDVGTASS